MVTRGLTRRLSHGIGVQLGVGRPISQASALRDRPLLALRAPIGFKIQNCARSQGSCRSDDVVDRSLTIAVDAEDEAVDGKNTKFDKMILDNLGGNRGGEDEGEIIDYSEGFGVSAEMEVKTSGHNRASSRRLAKFAGRHP